MRKLNKTIKQHTSKNQSKKKKNIAVSEYISYLLTVIEKNTEFEIEKVYFKKVSEFLFLERYFEEEMKAKEVDIVEYFYNYFDHDLYGINEDKIKTMYLELNTPDNIVRNRMKLISLRVPIIQRILTN